jgi:nitroreductase
MDVLDAIRSRRSHRAFKNQPVEAEKINTILEAGHWAPSPANNQPWEFVVVTNESARRRLQELSKAAKQTGNIEIHGYRYIRPLPQGTDVLQQGSETLKNYSLSFLKNVPVIIGVVGLPTTTIRRTTPQETEDSYKYACAAAIQNMLLAAESLGLGSLWFTLFDQDLMRQFLHIDGSKHLVALVLIGYPAATPPSPGRLPLASKIRRIE